MQYFCQACLSTGDNVSLMTVAEVDVYKEFICKTSWQPSNYLHICVFCRCLLRKLTRFMTQCWSSQELLHDLVQQDTKLIAKAIPCYNLQCTTPKVVCVGPETLVEAEKPDAESSEDRAVGGPCSEDEDNVPLVMFRSAGDGEDAGAETQRVDRTEANGHADGVSKPHKKKKKKHKKEKTLREGFTSRMVQETDEYLVIKLTKEQVLQEMAENAKSERYQMAPYKCERCVKGFNFEDVLSTHMEKHSPKNGVVQCELCGQYCAGAVSLRGHMKSHTTRYRCKVCGLVRLSRQHVLEHHALAHAAAGAHVYSCQRCHFTTNKRTVIQHHVRTHAAREPHACHRCGKLYKNLETLRIHITRHETHRRHQCARCPLSFVYVSQLRRHVRAVHERREYYCVECDVLFNSMDTLKLHFQKAKRHRDAASFKHECRHCGQRFVSAATLATHEHSAHGADKRARCELCTAPRAYSSRDALRVHLRRAHAPGHVTTCSQRKSTAPAHAHADADGAQEL